MPDGKERQSSGTSGLAGALVLLALATGAFVARDVPWLGARPAEAPLKVSRYAALQDVDARLWQDPLAAITRSREEYERRNKADHALPRHRALELSREFCRRAPAVVVGAMVPGGPYADDGEFRRRARYAALAGLSQGNYFPEDPDHLGYIVPHGDFARLWLTYSERPPPFIGYEWLAAGPYVADPPIRAAAGADSALLIWLDGTLFGTRTVAKLEALQQQLAQSCAARGPPRLSILGPGDSSLLRDLVNASRPEAIGTRTAAGPGNALRPSIVFYDYASTADAEYLGVPAGVDRSLAFYPGHDYAVLRTITTDRDLARALYRELQRREAAGPGPPRHIVLVSERDSLYGRSLAAEMTQVLCQDVPEGSPGVPGCSDRIHPYTYLRGLDGQRPEYQGTADAAAAPDAVDTGAQHAAGGRKIEQAQGQAQLDYLRRMAGELSALQDGLLDQAVPQRIDAIGILGSDVYDKLLVLQALRPRFPSATFFTTDIDARLLHPDQLAWTRGLVVATGYGLGLDPGLQWPIPPFRDGYQTALYFSTLVALQNAGESTCCRLSQAGLDGWLWQPRVFQIGRGKLFDYSQPPPPTASGEARPRCLLRAICIDIHPLPSPMFKSFKDRPGPLRLSYLGAICGLLLLAAVTGWLTRLAAWTEAAERSRAGRIARRTLVGGTALALVALVVPLPYGWEFVAGFLTEGLEGTPIHFFEGVSLWPTELFRAIALLLAVLSIFLCWRDLDRNADDTARKFQWEGERRQLIADVHQKYRGVRWWKRLLRMFSFRIGAPDRVPADPATGLGQDATDFWTTYIYQGRGNARLARMVVATVLYIGLAFLVAMWMGFVPDPHRGRLAGAVNQWLTPVAVACMLALIFFVADASALCIQFVIALRADRPEPADKSKAAPPVSRWPEGTVKHYCDKLQVDPGQVDHWIEMHLIACRTRIVARLVYYPFGVLALMVLARSSVFNNWAMPPALLVIIGGAVAIVLASAVVLRWTAEVSRRKAIWRMANEIIRLRGLGREGIERAEQLAKMVEQIRDLRAGAFAPYSQQPLIKALLLPLTSFGAPELIEYFTLLNL